MTEKNNKPMAVICEQPVPQTQYAGALAFAGAWNRFGVSDILANSKINYGKDGDLAKDCALALGLGPLVGATSIRQTAQRFGGEASKDNLEEDELLSNMFDHSFSQRTLSRFVNQERYDWAEFQRQRILQLSCNPGFQFHEKGVLILDDFPLPKPYAREMEHLRPVWDNNLKRTVLGYAMVHLYYYHPSGYSFPLYIEPWLKTSLTGETVAKPKQARRRAKEGEERNKMDIALDAIELLLPDLSAFEVLVMDSWYTSRWFCHELTGLNVPWIGDADSQRKFEIVVDDDNVENPYLTVPEIYEKYADQLRPIKNFKKGVKALSLPAIMRKDLYTKKEQEVELVVVTGLHKDRENDKGYKVLVCNKRTWSTKRILRLFSYRPKIEQVHRQGKQHEGWNEFHTRSIEALHAHVGISLLRSTVLYLMQVWEPVLAKYSIRELIDHLIGYLSVLTISPTGQLTVHFNRHYPALSFVT